MRSAFSLAAYTAGDDKHDLDMGVVYTFFGEKMVSMDAVYRKPAGNYIRIHLV